MKTINYILSLAIATIIFSSCEKESFEPSGNLSDTVTVAYLQDQIDQLQSELDSIKTQPIYIYGGSNVLIEAIYIDSTNSYVYRTYNTNDKIEEGKLIITGIINDSLSFNPNVLSQFSK